MTDSERDQDMTEPAWTTRRTALKTITAAVGGHTMVGTIDSARAADPGRGHGHETVVEIVARHDHDDHDGEDHLFDLDKETVPSGWTTFTFDNPTEHTHFVFSNKVPQQAIDDAKAEGMDLLAFWIETVTKPFQFFMDATYVDGKEPDPDDNTDIYDTLFPPWFGDVTYYGGPGLTSGGRSSRTTVDLAPGEYIVECYVKNGANDFHSYRGMIELLTVTDEDGDAAEPESTLELTLDTDGLAAPGSVRPGRHTVAVRFDGQREYPNLVGHDIHLVRLDEETALEDVTGWMDWTSPSELVADGNEPGPFLGGVQDIWTADLPRTGYLDVLLKPGEYAWVAEVPDPKESGLVQKFTVPAGRQDGGDSS